MAYDERLAGRIRRALGARPGLTERTMFGGLAFLSEGRMCCGVLGGALVLKLGNEGARQALAEPHTRPMDFTGKTIRSMVFVDPAGLATDAQLRRWLGQALAHVATLPPKA